jgi:hypothetical protein
MDDKTTKTEVKTISGPKAALASFIRPRDGVRIWVFARKGENPENAISRVKKHNGAGDTAHQMVG